MFVRSIRRLGCTPVLLTTTPERYDFVEPRRLRTLRVDTGDPRQVVLECHRIQQEEGLAGVLSSSEYFVHTAAQVARQLGLAGPPPEAVALCRDKVVQRRTLRRAGVPVPDFRAATTPEDLEQAVSDLGDGSLVVKPSQASGSLGVRLCPTREDALRHGLRLLAGAISEPRAGTVTRVLVERFIDAPEYSAEVFDGRCFGITRKYLGARPFFVETGHDFPADLGPDLAGSLASTAEAACRAVGLAWGPAHVEILAAADGPAVVEINPRLAGGRIPQLVLLATGVDLTLETTRIHCGRPATLRRTRRRSTAIRFVLVETPGRLVAVSGLDDARKVEGVTEAVVYPGIGRELMRHRDYRDRIGHVIASDDLPRCGELAERARDLIAAVVRDH